MIQIRSNTLPKLSNDTAYLFYADVNSVESFDKAKFDGWLSQSELKHLNSLIFENDRKLYRISHLMLRWALSSYTHNDPAELEFVVNDYGKPSLINNNDFSFNLSHSNGTAVLAVSKSNHIGVDIEKIDYQKDIHAILDNFFHPKEVAQFNQLLNKQKNALFYKLWTLKEAFIKAKGMGLSIPLDTFFFNLSGSPSLEVELHSELGENIEDWQFMLFEPQYYTNFFTALAVKAKSLNLEAFDVDLNTQTIKQHKLRVITKTSSAY